MQAFYNDDGSCCYSNNYFITSNTLDKVFNLGGSIFTSIDVDTINSYFKDKEVLNSLTQPVVYPPVYAMKSGISWELGYLVKPTHSSIRLQTYSNDLGYSCLYDTGKNSDAISYKCNNTPALDWGLNDQLIVKLASPNSMYIQDPSTNLCLSLDQDNNENIIWDTCNKNSEWVRYGNNTISHYNYRNFYLDISTLKNVPYALLSIHKANDRDKSILSWHMIPSINRWVLEE
nr:hypothetical protein [uncultured Haemophilus sp.]